MNNAELREKATAWATKMTDRRFAGRKGHGGAPVSFLNLRREDLAALLIVAYEVGAVSCSSKAEGRS